MSEPVEKLTNNDAAVERAAQWGVATYGAPVFDAGMTFKEYGQTGLRQYSGWVREEFLPQLQGRQAARVYREMQDNNATIGAMLFGITQTMRKIEWRVKAANATPEALAEAQFADTLRFDMCYDRETEILTERGWVLFETLTEDDRVAQRGADDRLEFVRPSKIHVYDFDGKLMGNKGDAVDFLVTPSHRMLFAPRTGRKHDSGQKTNLGIHKCEDIYNRCGWVSKRVTWEGESCGLDANWLEFLGFALADGCVLRNQVVLIQKETEYVVDLIERCDLTDKMGERPVNGSTQWALCDTAIARKMSEDFGGTSRFKRLPQWLKRATPAEIRSFLTGFAEGDGWEADTGLMALSTSSKQLADDLQELAMKAGYVATLLNRTASPDSFAPGSAQYRVSLWSDRKDHAYPYLKTGRGWYEQDYTGKVHCVSVPSGVVMVRRGGKAMWCGNSHTWEDFIGEALSMLTYGYAAHEIVYKQRLGRQPDRAQAGDDALASSQFDDGRIGIRKLPIRGQDTVIRWYFGPNGQVLGLTQQPYTGAINNIPIEKLLLFRPTSHKNNPEGRSILRNCYRSWYFLKRFEEEEAIFYERMSGVPIMWIPQELMDAAAAGDANAVAQVNAYKRMVTNTKIGEQMGLLLPSNTWPNAMGAQGATRMYEFQLVTPQGRAALDSDKVISRHRLDMLMTVLADFIALGHASHGTQSLAESKIDMFFQAIEGWVNSIAAVVNRYLLPRVWEINGLDPGLMPEFEPDLAQRIDIAALGDFVVKLAQSGMQMFPDPDLENYLRNAAGMPDLGETAYALNADTSPEDQKVSDLNSAAAPGRAWPRPAAVTTPTAEAQASGAVVKPQMNTQVKKDIEAMLSAGAERMRRRHLVTR